MAAAAAAAEVGGPGPDEARAARPLDMLNLFLADVRDGLGPYLAIYLLTAQGWDEAGTGAVLAIGGFASVLAKVPAGVLVDALPSKRLLVAVSAVAITAASLVIPLAPSFWAVAGSQVVSGAAAALVAPAVAALTLGITGPARFTPRMGRNQAWNHGGNAASAAAAGLLSYWYGPVAVFAVMALLAVASLVAVYRIPADAVDPRRAGGRPAAGAEGGGGGGGGWRGLLRSRPLMVLAASVALFHFANAPMLPLVGQKIAGQVDAGLATTMMSACIVAAQAVMVGMAWLAGRYADGWGRKPLFLAAFAVLPLRGFLYTLSDDPYWLIGVQLLDGVGAGLFGVLLPLMAQDLTRGTGHFGATLGGLAMAQDIGASSAQYAGGWAAANLGYSAAFLGLGGVAVAGTALFALAMPETRGGAVVAGSGDGGGGPGGAAAPVPV